MIRHATRSALTAALGRGLLGGVALAVVIVVGVARREKRRDQDAVHVALHLVDVSR